MNPVLINTVLAFLIGIGLLALALIIVFIIKNNIPNMRGYLKGKLVDGSVYQMPLQPIMNDMIKHEMTTGDICFDVAQVNVMSAVQRDVNILKRHETTMDFSEVADHLELASENPTHAKMKFAWKNAQKEVVYE